MVDGWVYYNNALIPSCAPHEEPDVSKISSDEFWKTDAGTPYFARWTGDFDSNDYREFWYCIREAPFVIEELSRNSRKHIRQALKNCMVRIIDNVENSVEEIYNVYTSAGKRYKKYKDNSTLEGFRKGCQKNIQKGYVYWGAYNSDNQLIGYIIVDEKEDYVDTLVAKFHTDFLKLRASDALYACILDYYLNQKNKRYINSGTRNINHETGTQEYKERHFGYRKAYCRLCIQYNHKFELLIKFLYKFRKILKFFDFILIVHKINGLILMEEIIRKQRKQINT